MIHFLYPSSLFSKTEPDEAYLAEFTEAVNAGIPCSVYSEQDWLMGKLKITPEIAETSKVIYRGWMLTVEEYQTFTEALNRQNISLLTSVKQYRNCHHLPQWYPLCEEMTPKTIFPDNKEQIAHLLADYHWSGYFIKDYVKSLTTQRGSIAYSLKEIDDIIDELQKYRGRIEGGICIRELEDFQPDTEERYFVFEKHAFARNDIVPDIVQHIAQRIDSPFFSVDIILNQNNQPRLIELGDGQVSDVKQWPLERFMQIFKTNH